MAAIIRSNHVEPNFIKPFTRHSAILVPDISGGGGGLSTLWLTHFDEGAGSNFFDEVSGYAMNNVTQFSCVQAPVVFGLSALRMPATSGSARGYFLGGNELDSNQDFTVEGWARVTGNKYMLVRFVSPDTSQIIFQVAFGRVFPGIGYLQATFNYESNGGLLAQLSAAAAGLSTNTWIHWAVCWRAADRLLALFQSGSRVNLSPASHDPDVYTQNLNLVPYFTLASVSTNILYLDEFRISRGLRYDIDSPSYIEPVAPFVVD